MKASEIQIIFGKFLSADFLSDKEILLKQVYYLENHKDELTPSLVSFQGKAFEGPKLAKAFPNSCNRFQDFFVAEFWVRITTDGGFFIVSHAFNLDLDEIEKELNKIMGDQSKNYSSGERIALFLSLKYETVTGFLEDFNGKGTEYDKLAIEIHNNHGGTIGDHIYDI